MKRLAEIKRNGISAFFVKTEEQDLRWECDDKDFHSDLRFAQITAEKRAVDEDWFVPSAGDIIGHYVEFVADYTGSDIVWVRKIDDDVLV